MNGRLLSWGFRLLMPLLLTVVLGSGCAGGRGSRDSLSDSAASDTLPRADITHEATLYADSVLARMTTDEKIGQLFLPAIYAEDTPAVRSQLRHYADSLHIGGVMLLKGDTASAASLSRELHRLSVLPPIIAIDAEWGLAMRLRDAPEFPANGKLPADISENKLYEYGYEVARQCRRVGVNMVLGPVLDVNTTGDGRSLMARRCFGSAPGKVALMGVAYSRGLEDGHVISVAKHFPGIGASREDSHKMMPEVRRSREAVDSIDLFPFRQYIENQLSGVMVGHIFMNSLDSIRRPAAFSPYVIHGLLRGKMGFRGLVLTDALSMGGADGYGSEDALDAGADIVVAPLDTQEEIDRVKAALASGELSMATLDAAVRRILFYKSLFLVRRN